jgi:glycosyltransferase involved in cell wall biosynthesis
VEVYTARLASRLQQDTGWKVAVVTARLRPGQAQNCVERALVGGVTVYGVVQNYPYRGLPEAVDDPALDRVFADILRSFAPDLVAIQTLSGLSLGFVDVARDAGIPVAVHLHDGWWSCPSGGQRLHPDGSLCLPVDRTRCSACFASYCHREGPLERGARALANKMPAAVPPDTLHRAFQSLPSGGQQLLRRLNERGARLRERHSIGTAVVADGGETAPEIRSRDRRIREILARVDLVISPTRFLAQSLATDGLDFPALRIEPTGVPRAQQPPPPLREDGPLRVLFLGTWVQHKGPQVLARALATLPARLFDGGLIHARAVGPAPFPAFQQDVLAEARGRLVAGGEVEPDAVPQLLRSVDVVVVPSLWAENAPLVALEALSHGRPVLASDIGGLPELVRSGLDGELFPAGDAAALAGILERLADNRSAALDLARSIRPPRSLEDFAAAVEVAYSQVCDQHPVQATGT